MWKALTLVLVAAALASPVAQAEDSIVDRIILQEQAGQKPTQSTDERAVLRALGQAPTAPDLVQRIVAQERGRACDARVVGLQAPVQVVGDPDRFDYIDAGIGGAFAFALALTAAAAVAVWNTSRRRTA